ncbi:MAG: ArsR/SmtB family transcription factor [Flavobacteriia bacterium]|jgi:ArsR family transcriptional regulator
MGASKNLYFSEEQNNTANLFKALAHPARIAIIQHILATRLCICGDLVDVLPLSQATVSQHLKELKSANIIRGSIEGNSICYCLNQETIVQLNQFIHLLIKGSEDINELCC